MSCGGGALAAGASQRLRQAATAAGDREGEAHVLFEGAAADVVEDEGVRWGVRRSEAGTLREAHATKGACHNPRVLSAPESPLRPRRRERVAAALVLAAALLLSAAALPGRVAYLARLAAAGDARARGTIAADENLSPLATAGQVRWRRALAEGPPSGSGQAAAWSFFTGVRAPPGAGRRVFLARPNDLLYQYGNFLLFPARVEVTPAHGARLADGADLVRAAAPRTCADTDWLRAAGYAACIETRGHRLALIPVGGATP